MRITRWLEYGVLILAIIAREQAEGAKAVGASGIAEELGIARDYTLQVLHRLKDGGILSSSRGPHGGYALIKPAEEISLREIMTAAEGNTFEVICEAKPLIDSCDEQSKSCGLATVWFDLRDHINEFLEAKSLKELTPLIHAKDNGLVHLRQDLRAIEAVVDSRSKDIDTSQGIDASTPVEVS